MARKLRLEFPGAIYHVINRGNYRSHIFQTEGARAAFEACLFEACAKSGWRLHAYVLMSNHYHLAVETPEGNLVSGMHWLQATFANRFNALRGERGHLFQGRYKSLLVEEGPALGQLCHYLHLNPVRARLLPVAELTGFRYSSYWYLSRPEKRPKFLVAATALAEAGGLADEAPGWRAYEKYLAWQAEEGPAGRNKAFASLSRGWAIGSRDFKAGLVKDHALAADARAWEADGAREMREAGWGKELRAALRVLGRSERELSEGPVAAPWKVAVAVDLKERTQVSNPWLAERMGTDRPVYVSRLVSEMRRQKTPSAELVRLRKRKQG